jgi:hypothetical protein
LDPSQFHVHASAISLIIVPMFVVVLYFKLVGTGTCKVARTRNYYDEIKKDARPDLISAKVDVYEDFGMSRSLRGLSTAAGRHGVRNE